MNRVDKIAFITKAAPGIQEYPYAHFKKDISLYPAFESSLSVFENLGEKEK